MKRLISVLLIAVLLISMLPTAAFAAEDGSLTAVTKAYPNTHPNTWVNTGDQQKDIVEIAKTQIGYVESFDNLTKYNYWYYGADTSVSWCGTFISWCAAQASIPNTIIRKNALAGGFTTANMQTNPFGCPAYAFGSTAPQLGDIIFVAPSGSGTSEHVGLIIDIDNEYIYTAEGNVSDTCGLRQYSLRTGAQQYTGSHIIFYARPKYENHSTTVTPPTPPTPVEPEPEPCSHQFEETYVAPTCTEDGYTMSTCVLCSYSTRKDIPATGHLFVEEEVVYVDPTIAESRYRCVYCDGDLIATPGHSFSSVYSPATCTEGGRITYTCDCGYSFTQNTNDVPAHKWGAWQVLYSAQYFGYGMMKRTCSACNEVQQEQFRDDTGFTDINNAQYYYLPTLWAYGNNITTGVSQTEFCPFMICTRAQVVTFLYREAGCPEPTITENPFDDVIPNTYYYKAVLWAVENGITTGMDAHTFAPDLPCTRGQVVTFLYRAAGSPNVNGVANPFLDVNQAFYRTPILWAISQGITNGMSADAFVPLGNCQRGQVVTFLYRYDGADSPMDVRQQ